MKGQQVCTFSEFNFSRKRDALTAFKNMGFAKSLFGEPKGLAFGRLMGAGSGNGFSIFPNFRKYAYFAIWNSEEEAASFYASNEKMRWYESHASDSVKFWLRPLSSRGKWGGLNILEENKPEEENFVVGVLTRATVKPRYVPSFWIRTPEVSHFMVDADGILYRAGVGEYPLFMQTTFSLWENKEKLHDAAFGSNAHGDAVKLVREHGWFSEDLFAHFEVYKIESQGNKYADLSGNFIRA